MQIWNPSFFSSRFLLKNVWGYWSHQQFDVYWFSWHLYGKLVLSKKQVYVYLRWQLSVNGKKHAASSAKLCKVSSSWDKVFKNGPSKIWGRQSLKNFSWSILESFVPVVAVILASAGSKLSVSRSQNAIYFFIIAMPKKSHFSIFAM